MPPVGGLTVTSREREQDHPKIESPPDFDSLCNRCQACRTITTQTSKFLMCTLRPTKYPRQPVSNCPSFVRRV